MMLGIGLACTLLLLQLAQAATNSFYTEKNSPVFNLTTKNYKNLVTDSHDTWIIEYYAPWCEHCVTLKPNFIEAAKKMLGKVRFGAVDCTNSEAQSICSTEAVRGYPTIKVHSIDSNGNRNNAVPYQRGRDSKSLIQFAESVVPTFALHKLTKMNYKEFTENKSPKMIFFSQQPKPPLLAYGLATEFYPSVKVAFASDIPELVKMYSVTEFPTVVAVKSEDSVEKFVGKEEISVSSLRHALAELAKIPMPIIELASQDVFRRECLADKNVICAIAFLPKDDEFHESVREFESNLTVVKNISEKINNVRFMWVNPLKYKQPFPSLSIPDVYPGFVIVQPGQNTYRTSNAAFEVSSLSQFIQSVIAGKIGMVKYNGDLELEKTTENMEL